MFENFSREQALRIASTVVGVASLFGVDLEGKGLGVENLTAFLVVGALIVANVWGFFLRLQKGDVTVGGFRK